MGKNKRSQNNSKQKIERLIKSKNFKEYNKKQYLINHLSNYLYGNFIKLKLDKNDFKNVSVFKILSLIEGKTNFNITIGDAENILKVIKIKYWESKLKEYLTKNLYKIQK